MDPLKRVEELRDQIDEIDREIVRLLNERAALVKEIIKVKRENKLPLYDPKREEEIFENIREASKGPLFAQAIIDIYEEILNWMKRLADEE